MSKYVNAADAAEKIAEKRGIRIADLCDTFGDIPAADVAEVRHGRWEAWMPDKNGETREFICTGCRFMVEMSWKQKECDYEWCPYCGCKMDKEEADDKKQPEEAPGE